MEASDYKKLKLTDWGLIQYGRENNCMSPIRLEGLENPVQCGKCPLCQAKRRRDWSFRLGIEEKHSISSYFVTMTYDEISMPRINNVGTLDRTDVQGYIKRLRNVQRKKVGELFNCNRELAQQIINDYSDYKIKYYAVGEYGSKTRRPHYHMLIFNLIPSLTQSIQDEWKNTKQKKLLGTTKVGTVTPQSINYCTKYMLKQQFGKKDWRVKPFTLMSTRPAIGSQYLDTHSNHHIEQGTLTCRNVNGNFQALPRFYRDRIFTDEAHRKLIIEQNIREYKEKQNLEISRLQEAGKLTPALELSKIQDVKRKHYKQLKETL